MLTEFDRIKTSNVTWFLQSGQVIADEVIE